MGTRQSDALPLRLGIIGWHDGGAGQIHSWFEQQSQVEIVCFLSPDNGPLQAQKIQRRVSKFSYPENGTFKGLPLVIDKEWWRAIEQYRVDAVTVILENPKQRLAEIENARKNGVTLHSIIHPSVTISAEVSIGESVVIFPKTYIGYRAEIGDGVVINTGSQIDHHCKIGSGSTIDPGCVLAGNVFVDECAHLHTGVTVINKIEIGKDSVVGAGALVLRNVNPGTMNYGLPSRQISR